MATSSSKPPLPDLTAGIDAIEITEGKAFVGRVGDDDVMVVRAGSEIFAVGAHCTHYHGPLAEGLVVGDTVRCPWHHACFSLRSGEAVRAPALDAIDCWQVERRGGKIVVTGKQKPSPKPALAGKTPESVVIIGGGGAGLAAADMLRRDGYGGRITMLSADDSPPCDRPNLSKDYLAGGAQDDWIPLRPPEFYNDHRIDLQLNSRVTLIDTRAREVHLDTGLRHKYGALLIATGADPVKLPIPGADGAHVHYLRSFRDSKAIVADATAGTRAVVIGASFIGLEVAASLRTRGLHVDVVAPDALPLERILGAQVGQLVKKTHEAHDVAFHLGQTVTKIDGRTVTLSGGGQLEADFVVIGVGVRPATDLAANAGISVDRGITVNEFLETDAPGVFAAGDVARWHDRRSGERRRVEHWVVAERMGQTAARNILGRREAFESVPFFWSRHFDLTINYVGHAERWDAIKIDGDLSSLDCAVAYTQGNRTLAVATISRDLVSLRAEASMETRAAHVDLMMGVHR